jgi:hypothetical protein
MGVKEVKDPTIPFVDCDEVPKNGSIVDTVSIRPRQEGMSKSESGPYLNLLLKSGESITGILRLSNVFTMVCSAWARPTMYGRQCCAQATNPPTNVSFPVKATSTGPAHPL